MLQPFLKDLVAIKTRYDKKPTRDRELICRAGAHIGCVVLKLQRPAWTNDDLSKIGNKSGIFFSIWVGEKGARVGKADYNIHAMTVRSLKQYRLTGIDFCDRFRKAFARKRKSWPNLSTDFGCQTLMQGWFKIDTKTFARDVEALMNRFIKEVVPIIDDLLEKQTKPVKPTVLR